ncbi:PHP domain-containing protein [Microbacterium sp. NPDC055312]
MSALRLAPHIHSSFSDDSDWPLTRLVRVLRAAGFDGALVCDHDRTMDAELWTRVQQECDRLGDETGFLLVPGIEYQDPDHVVHMPVFGRAAFYGRSPLIDDLVRQARADGAAAIFAHPRRRDAWQHFDPAWAAHLSGMEVWNRKYDGVRPNEWALQQAEQHRLAATVALDWHGTRQLYPLALRVPSTQRGSNRERGDAVVAAMLAGRTHATAFGVDVQRFSHGLLGQSSRGFESARQWMAPRVRRVEKLIRRAS